MKDLETQRHYRLKAIRDVMEGTNSIKVQGEIIEIVNGVVPLYFMLQDYYLFSSCNEMSRRLPTDFEADSVLVIKNKKEFIARLRISLLAIYPKWEHLDGDVYYYDPYNDLPTDTNQEFYKHISYAYQKEHRCIIRPRSIDGSNISLEPFFVELGSLNDICETINS